MSSAENGGQPFPLDEQTFEVNKTKRPADASVVAMELARIKKRSEGRGNFYN